MKTIEELRAIKERNRGAVINRSEKGVPTVNVHMGTCGIAAGARDVLDAIMDEIRRRNVENIHVVQSGCPGMCVNEPMLTLTIPGEEPYVYIKVTPDNAKNIILHHVVNRQPVREWLLNLEK